MPRAEYWKKRFELIEKAAHDKGVAYYETLEREYRKATWAIEGDIAKWYLRFAGNNSLTLTEAKKQLTGSELEEFRWSLDDYTAAAKGIKNMDPVAARQLENAGVKHHISRLESLKYELQMKTELLFGNQVDGLEESLKDIYQDTYYKSAFELQVGTHAGRSLQVIDEKQLDTALTKPWTSDNRTFRNRCWTNKTALVNEVHTQLTQDIIRGLPPDKAIKEISKKFGVSKQKAGRLVMTESAYISSLAQKDMYTRSNVKNVQFLASLDEKTCDECGDMDKKVIPLTGYEPGVTVPPIHPWCRCTTIPHFDDDTKGERAARDEDDKTNFVPGDTTFEEWKEKYVDKTDKKGIIDLDDAQKSLYNIVTSGRRNDVPLTVQQIQDAKDFAVSLGMHPDRISYRESYNTGYGLEFDLLILGTDLYPSTHIRQGTRYANGRISWKAGLGHELIGHREAAIKGWTQTNDLLEEVQASIRAARFTPDISRTERIALLRDAVARLPREIRLRDIKNTLNILER